MTPVRPFPVLAVLCVLAAGCGQSGAGEQAAPTPVPAPTSAEATPTATASTLPSAPVAVPSGAGLMVVLQGDGLGLSSGAATTSIAFGSPRGPLETALRATLGTGREQALPDCGQGPRRAVQYDGFSILLRGSSFVGWTERGSAERNLTTAEGIGLQATLTEVRESLGAVDVSNDSLGPEFASAAGLSGLLDGTTPQSRVTSMSGGETCFSR